jgi:hypothetical protein
MKCYRAIERHLNFELALEVCSAEYNAHLLTIATEDEQGFLSGIASLIFFGIFKHFLCIGLPMKISMKLIYL